MTQSIKKNRQIGSNTPHGSKIVKNYETKHIREFVYRNKPRIINGQFIETMYFKVYR